MDRLLLVGIVLPVALCAAMLSAAWRPWRREAPPGAGQWSGGLAFGAAFLVSGHAAEVFWTFPPHLSWHWIVYLAAAGALLGAADALGWLHRAHWALLIALACATGLLLVGTWAEHYWAWRSGAAFVVLTLLAGLRALRHRRGAAIPLGLCLAFTAASVILALAPTLKLATMAASMAACLGAGVLLAWWRPRIAPLAGAMPLFAVTLPGLLLAGLTTSSDVRAWPFVLCALAPAGLLIDTRPALRVAGVLGAVLIAAAGAVIP